MTSRVSALRPVAGQPDPLVAGAEDEAIMAMARRLIANRATHVLCFYETADDEIAWEDTHNMSTPHQLGLLIMCSPLINPKEDK